jgi:aminocarboxymuconate-semialdehyde decarboxylase
VYVDTVVYTPESVAQLVATMGADHVLLGTDYPFDMGEDDPAGLIERTPGLSAEEREMLVGGNAARLLGVHATSGVTYQHPENRGLPSEGTARGR